MWKDQKTGHLVLSGSPTCEKEVGEPECAHCVYIVSGKEVFVGEESHFLNGKPWSEIEATSVYVPVEESFAPLKKYLLDSCKKMGCQKDLGAFRLPLEVAKPTPVPLE